MAEDRHRFGLGDAGGVRELRRPHDREIASNGPFDGVYLCLQARWPCAACRGPKPSSRGGCARSSGAKAVIAGTFDPHGNEDEEFLRQADMAFTVKYFPHYDSHLQGERAARMLVRAIRGNYRPAHATVKVPIISPTVVQWTGASPWMDLVQRALTWEAREPDVYVNVFFGFPFADVPDVGMTIQVMTNGNPSSRAASPTTWRMGVAPARGAAGLDQDPQDRGRRGAGEAGRGAGATPVVLADHSDRSGYATWLLREIIAQELRNVLIATIAEAKAIDTLKARAEAGRRVRHGGRRPGGRVGRQAGAHQGHHPQRDRGLRPALGLRRASATATS